MLDRTLEEVVQTSLGDLGYVSCCVQVLCMLRIVRWTGMPNLVGLFKNEKHKEAKSAVVLTDTIPTHVYCVISCSNNGINRHHV